MIVFSYFIELSKNCLSVEKSCAPFNIEFVDVYLGFFAPVFDLAGKDIPLFQASAKLLAS